ncbi:MAG: cob(I)yrinic acid a,c-diamide adenosyltransferase [bacterium]
MRRFHRRKFSRTNKHTVRDHGLSILYFGNGKGKTTAAIGLALRAHGAGMNVCVVQLMKSLAWQSHERKAFAELKIPVHVLGSGFVGIIDDHHSLAFHKQKAKAALAFTRRLLTSGRYDVVIADEAVSAVDEGLLTVRDILGLIKQKPKPAHLVLTGHSRYPKIIAACDLATEMKNVKHPYYTEGLLAQRGIDY